MARPVQSNGGDRQSFPRCDDPGRRVRTGKGGRRASGTSGSPTSWTPRTRGRPDDTLVMRVRGRRRTSGADRPSTLGRAGVARVRRPAELDHAVTSDRHPAGGGRRAGPVGVEYRRTHADLLPRSRTELDLRREPADEGLLPRPFDLPEPRRTLRAGVRLDAGAIYTVVSERPLVTATSLRTQYPDAMPEEISRQYAAVAHDDRPGPPARARHHGGRADPVRQGPGDRALSVHPHEVLARHPSAAPWPRRRGPVPVRRSPRLLRADRHDPGGHAPRAGIPRAWPWGTPPASAIRSPVSTRSRPAMRTHGPRSTSPGSDGRASTRPPRCRSPVTRSSTRPAPARSTISAPDSTSRAGCSSASWSSARWWRWSSRSGTSRRPRRIAISRSWASQHLARLERMGRARGSAARVRARRHPPSSARGTLAPGRAGDLEDIGAALDQAMFGDHPIDPATMTHVDALLQELTAEWDRIRHPEDLVPA